MIKKLQLTGAVVIAAMTVLSGPVLASQSSKNTWRNLAIGSGALGIIGLANHNSTETLVGAAGAAYSANRYEQDRHHQSQARDRHQAWERHQAYERHLAWERDHHQGYDSNHG